MRNFLLNADDVASDSALSYNLGPFNYHDVFKEKGIFARHFEDLLIEYSSQDQMEQEESIGNLLQRAKARAEADRSNGFPLVSIGKQNEIQDIVFLKYRLSLISIFKKSFNPSMKRLYNFYVEFETAYNSSLRHSLKATNSFH